VAKFGDQRPSKETSIATDSEELLPGPALAVRRRTVLRAAGLLALTGGGAAALASCSPQTETGAPPATPAAETASPQASPSPTPDATSSKPSGARAPNGPSVATSQVPVGGGVILEDADYVVTQPSKGDYKAFSKICTHQGCPVASVNNGIIHCNCHGSEYSIEDGSVTNPPATKPLAEAETTVSEGKVYVTG
jgi:Rieske Fe-S protein